MLSLEKLVRTIFNRGTARYPVHQIVIQVIAVPFALVTGADASVLRHRKGILLRHPRLHAFDELFGLFLLLLGSGISVGIGPGEARATLLLVVGFAVDFAQGLGLVGSRGMEGAVVFGGGRLVVLEVDCVLGRSALLVRAPSRQLEGRRKEEEEVAGRAGWAAPPW
jgi:hypothetical protein